MKKRILIGMGILFIAAILNSGCSKPEDKKAEAPAVKMETAQPVEEKAAAMQEKAAAMQEEAAAMQEKAATMQEEAEKVVPVKESPTMTKQEGAEVLKEMSQQAVDAVKQLSGDQSTMEAAKAASGMKVPAVETPPAPMETPAITEETLKEKAIEQGMKLPSKY